MNHKLRYFMICVILCSLCIPFFYFRLLDQRDLSTTKQWVGKQNNKEIIEKYPVVQGLYTSFYGEDHEKSSYNINNLSQFSEEQRSLLNTIKDSFEKEINTLINKGILEEEYLNLSSNVPFTVPFGTLTISENKTGTHNLEMIYHIENGNVEEATFTLDKQSNKIIGFTIYNSNVKIMSKKQKYTRLHKFIKYLDIADIEDWSQIEGSLISYQLRAELRITEIHEDKTNSFTVSFIPIGRQEPSRIELY